MHTKLIAATSRLATTLGGRARAAAFSLSGTPYLKASAESQQRRNLSIVKKSKFILLDLTSFRIFYVRCRAALGDAKLLSSESACAFSHCVWSKQSAPIAVFAICQLALVPLGTSALGHTGTIEKSHAEVLTAEYHASRRGRHRVWLLRQRARLALPKA